MHILLSVILLKLSIRSVSVRSKQAGDIDAVGEIQIFDLAWGRDDQICRVRANRNGNPDTYNFLDRPAVLINEDPN